MSIAAQKEATAHAEKFEYQAKVSRLLDLIVHSLYSHKEVFLRELVTNASDVLDKLQFLSVIEPICWRPIPTWKLEFKMTKRMAHLTITSSFLRSPVPTVN